MRLTLRSSDKRSRIDPEVFRKSQLYLETRFPPCSLLARKRGYRHAVPAMAFSSTQLVSDPTLSPYSQTWTAGTRACPDYTGGSRRTRWRDTQAKSLKMRPITQEGVHCRSVSTHQGRFKTSLFTVVGR